MAGPPYVTDDPQPTDTGHWEIYAFGSGEHVAGGAAGQTGLDINYGAAKGLQLNVVAPADYDTGPPARFGAGDVELAAKYEFIRQRAGGWLPDIAVYPRLFLPTSGAGLGDGRASLFLPVFAQKDFGAWSTFGGGGYDINPGPGNRNYWLLGWALTRKINDRLSLGGEIYRQTSDMVGKPATTAVAIGATYQLTTHFALMASGGPSLDSARGAQQSAIYLALQFTY
jgi:hypothetical protein